MRQFSSRNVPIPTPQAGATDPAGLTSRTAADARVLEASTLVALPIVGELAWSADSNSLFLASTRSGRLNIWKWRMGEESLTALTTSDQAQRGLAPLPDGRSLLFLQDVDGDEYYDIYRLDLISGSYVNLTNDPWISCDGLRVSPSGGEVAFALKAKQNSQRDIGVLEFKSLRIRNLTHDPAADGFWSPVAWSADGRYLIANREENLLAGGARPWRIDTWTGERIALVPFREKGRDVAVGLLRDGDHLLLTSNHGNNQSRAALYDIPADRYRWFPDSPWEQSAIALAADGKVALYRNWEDTRSVLWTLDLVSWRATLLPLPPGSNEPCCMPRFAPEGQPFAPDSRRLALSHSSGDSPQSVWLIDLNQGTAEKPAPLRGPGIGRLPPSEIVTFKSFDGTLISGVLTLPFNLRRDTRNAAIVIPHGGPTAASNDDFDLKATFLASHGYIVFRPNYRGSTGYGALFREAERFDMGNGDLADLVAAREFLLATKFVSPDRVGVTGASAGGWLSLLALGKHPGLFAAAVQIVGVVDWATFLDNADPVLRAYVVSLFGSADARHEDYRSASPITFIDRINVPLLSIAGARDMRVPVQQAEQLEAVLKAKGIPSQTVIYPDEGHFFLKRENIVDELERTVAWFDQYL